MHKGTTGGSLGGVEKSPARAKRDAARRRAQDKQFAAKNGEVVVSFKCICPKASCRVHPSV